MYCIKKNIEKEKGNIYFKHKLTYNILTYNTLINFVFLHVYGSTYLCSNIHKKYLRLPQFFLMHYILFFFNRRIISCILRKKKIKTFSIKIWYMGRNWLKFLLLLLKYLKKYQPIKFQDFMILIIKTALNFIHVYVKFCWLN